MSPEHDVDTLTRRWLHEGPTVIPPHIVDTALAEVHRTRQRRAGALRRFLPVNMTTARVAVAALALTLLVSIGVTLRYPATGPAAVSAPACPSPAVTAAADQSPADSPPPLDATFTSPLLGYSVRYPACWTITPATRLWTTTQGALWGSPVMDELRGPTARLTVESQPLEAGQTGDAWMAAYLGAGVDATTISGLPTMVVGDQVGVFNPTQCGVLASGGAVVPGARLFDLVVVDGERGYNFTVDGNVTESFVRAMLATVLFDPASAVDVLPSPSP